MKILREERGTMLVTTLFFFLCLCGIVSLSLMAGQTDELQMRTQQTADLITKGARAAGKYTFIDESGRRRQRLFATTSEANKYGASIVRGAREEAEILERSNRGQLLRTGAGVSVVHQKGEKQSLYQQGIYHVTVEIKKKITLLQESFDLRFQRVSQAEISRN